MKILLTNDDGIHAEGIVALYHAVKSLGEVTIVAPISQRSAAGHSITIADPLRVEKVNKNGEFFGYATSGTPADCVKLAIRALGVQPDVVLSGINLGPNTGFSVLYSGTVSGATEGAVLGIPSIAISLCTFENPDYRVAADFAKKTAIRVYEKGLPKATLLNVNVPAANSDSIKGVRVVKQSKTALVESFDVRVDPRKRTYYWLTGELTDLDGEKDSDIDAINKDCISITPIQCDMTSYGLMDELKQWQFD